MAHLLTESEIIAVVRAMHKPDAIASPMVWEVWEDGEITLTKGGDIYMQRNLHCDVPGDSGLSLPTNSLFPRYEGAKHSRVVVENREEAMLARSYIVG